jgi:hypothetical protein
MRFRYKLRALLGILTAIAVAVTLLGYRVRRLADFKECVAAANRNDVIMEVQWWPGQEAGYKYEPPHTFVGRYLSLPFVTRISSNYPGEYENWFRSASRLGRWRYVWLCGDEFNAGHLQVLAEMDSVEELFLFSGQFAFEESRGEMAVAIARLDTLRVLRIRGIADAPEIAESVSDLPKLEHLEIELDRDSVAAMQEYRCKDNLRVLEIALLDAPREYPFDRLSQFPKLEILTLKGPLLDENLTKLKDVLPLLSELSIDAGRLSNDGLSQLEACRRLRRLSISGTISELKFLKNLNVLHLSLEGQFLTFSMLAEVSDCRVSTLVISGSVDSESASAIASWRNLQFVDLTNADISPGDAQKILASISRRRDSN